VVTTTIRLRFDARSTAGDGPLIRVHWGYTFWKAFFRFWTYFLHRYYAKEDLETRSEQNGKSTNRCIHSLLLTYFVLFLVRRHGKGPPTVVLNRAPTYANPAPEGRVWSQPMLPLCGRPTRSRNTHNSKSRDRERVHWNINTGNVHATELLSIEFSGARSAMARSGYWTYLGKYTCARKINNQPVVRKHFSLPEFLGSTP